MLKLILMILMIICLGQAPVQKLKMIKSSIFQDLIKLKLLILEELHSTLNIIVKLSILGYH